jgi:hypothetical protein
MTRLNLSRPPFLPVAPQEYEPRFQNQHSDVLRLYFNQLDNALAAIVGSNGGQYVDCPNGLFFNTADQTYAATNTAYPVVFNATYLNNAVALQALSTSRVAVTVGGIYNFQYSGQLSSTNSSAKTVWLWIRRNGTNIGYSTHVYSISGSGTQQEINWNFNIDLAAGEYLELVTATDDTNVQLDASTASSPHPGIPSSVLSVNFIAPLPEPRPTPP